MMFHVRGCVNSADVQRAEVNLINTAQSCTVLNRLRGNISNTREFNRDVQKLRREFKI